MKKLLAIALIAASFTACDGDKKETETIGTDTTTQVVSTQDTVTKITDTTVTTTVVDGNKMSADTTKH